MRVALIYPNQTKLEELGQWQYPNIRTRKHPIIQLGLGYMCNAIKDHYPTFYLDNNVKKLTDDQLVNWVLDREIDVVGFGGTLTEWPQASTVASKLKSVKYDIITVYGGANATANPQKHVRYFDYVMRGYAENSFLHLLDGLSGKDLHEDVKGLCYGNLINCPSLKVDIEGLRPYRVPSWYKRQDADICPEPVDVVMSSRGCPFNCKFCSSKTVWGQTWLDRSVADVMDEVAYMMKTYGTKTIHFREDNFTVNKTRLEAMCKALYNVGVKWICQSRVKALDKPTIRMMKNSGCVLVCCGFESINDNTLRYLNKGHTSEDVISTIALLNAEGLHYSGGFMVGVLNEGEAEIKATLEYTKGLQTLMYNRVPRGAGRFVGFPTSETYDAMIADGLVAYDWQEGELLIPHTYHLTANQVEDCIGRYW